MSRSVLRRLVLAVVGTIAGLIVFAVGQVLCLFALLTPQPEPREPLLVPPLFIDGGQRTAAADRSALPDGGKTTLVDATYTTIADPLVALVGGLTSLGIARLGLRRRWAESARLMIGPFGTMVGVVVCGALGHKLLAGAGGRFGFTHVWWPLYWMAGVASLAGAIVSLGFAGGAAMWRRRRRTRR